MALSNKMLLAKRLRLLRKEKGLTQIEVATALQISNSTLSQYESCKRMPDYDVLCQLTELYNATADYILGLTDQRIPYSELSLEQNELLLFDSIKSEHPELFSNLILSQSLAAKDLYTLERLVVAFVESRTM